MRKRIVFGKIYNESNRFFDSRLLRVYTDSVHTVLGSVRFFFYSGDKDEPPHIHVERENMKAKFWLRPVRLKVVAGSVEVKSIGYSDLSKTIENIC